MSPIVLVFGRRQRRDARQTELAGVQKPPRHTFKQTGLRYSSRQLLSLRYGGVDVTRRIRVAACQMILAVLDHALHADNI
jgi:hypothetical protein